MSTIYAAFITTFLETNTTTFVSTFSISYCSTNIAAISTTNVPTFVSANNSYISAFCESIDAAIITTNHSTQHPTNKFSDDATKWSALNCTCSSPIFIPNCTSYFSKNKCTHLIYSYITTIVCPYYLSNTRSNT